jgi:hypothetical protein
MTNRREFIQIGMTATAWPLVAGTLPGAELGAMPEWAPLSTVVYDSRFAESVAFAERSRALGVRAMAIEADMTRLWYEDIYHQWQRGPAAIAGLTAHGPMFCFAELARDVRMRLVFRAEHRVGGAPAMHALSGPASMVSDAESACRRLDSFGAAMAGIVSRCPLGRSEIVVSSVGGEPDGPDEDALYTWMIAPAVRG